MRRLPILALRAGALAGVLTGACGELPSPSAPPPPAPPPAALPEKPAAIAVDFVPSRDGFAFVNRFRGSPLPFGLPAMGGVPDSFGLCGGMSFAALDHWVSRRPIPRTEAIPTDGSALYAYLYNRQVQSLGPMGMLAVRFAEWMGLPDGTTDGTQARTLAEWPQIQSQLALGRPVVLGLVLVSGKDTRELWHNHQVLAYAYDSHEGGAADIRIYDPNYPGDDAARLALTPVSLGDAGGAPAHGVATVRVTSSGRRTPVRGFFLMPYLPVDPPEVVREPGVSGGRSNPQTGGNR